MNYTNFLFLACLIALLVQSSNGVKSGYWGSWQQPELIEAIDTTLFTHIYYAFAIPKNDFTLDLVGVSSPDRLRYFTTTLRRKNPTIKIFLSIGGGDLPSDRINVFTNMASSEGSRRIFIDSAIRGARDNGFDGMDLDWEYPKDQVEMGYLGVLLEEWRAAIETEAKVTSRTPLLLAAAVHYSANMMYPIDRVYPVESIAKNMDWINLMAYDFHGSWENQTGAHTALFDENSIANTNYGLNKWIAAGVPKEKLVLGLAMYGYAWNLDNPNENSGIGAPAVPANPATKSFSEILEYNNVHGSTVVRDEETVSVYAVAGSKWIGYDDEECIRKKVLYTREQGIRGYFFWEIGQDSDWKLSRAASNT